ncbi:MAG TPA: DUF2157 domain-containing protein [Methylomirabilota bacterium]|nr:DUF2157 domain-containing protein [Methylomirabilota bacterium]
MNPDVVAAIARLRTDDVLSSQQAAFFDRVARRRLVSVRLEIRALLYLGVLLLTSGVGVLVVEHHQQIGPLVIALSIGLAALGCLVWATRQAPSFSWREVPSPSVALDYVLLLGLLLLAADLGYVEAQFTVLGPRWAHHLLVVGIVYLLAAYRWDSRAVLGLALSTLAAWRGVSLSVMARSGEAESAEAIRASAIVIGLLYLALAILSVRWRRKAHFEPVFGGTGLLLLLGGLVDGVLRSPAWALWLVMLIPLAGLVMAVAYYLGRSLYFAQGVLAAYVALVRWLFALFLRVESGWPFLLAAALGLGAIVLIFAAHRRMVER